MSGANVVKKVEGVAERRMMSKNDGWRDRILAGLNDNIHGEDDSGLAVVPQGDVRYFRPYWTGLRVAIRTESHPTNIYQRTHEWILGPGMFSARSKTGTDWQVCCTNLTITRC